MSETPTNFENYRNEKIAHLTSAIESCLNPYCQEIYNDEVRIVCDEAQTSAKTIVYTITIAEGSKWAAEKGTVIAYLHDRLEEELPDLLADFETDPAGLLEVPPVLIVSKRDTI